MSNYTYSSYHHTWLIFCIFSRAKNLLVLSCYEKGVSENFKPFFYSVRGVNSLQFDINQINLDEVTKKDERKILSYTTDIALYRYCPMKYFLVTSSKFIWLISNCKLFTPRTE